MITLRRYQADDAEAFYDAARESVDEVFPWLPWCHPDYTRKEAEQWTGSRGELFVHDKTHDAVIYAMLRSSWKNTGSPEEGGSENRP